MKSYVDESGVEECIVYWELMMEEFGMQQLIEGFRSRELNVTG